MISHHIIMQCQKSELKLKRNPGNSKWGRCPLVSFLSRVTNTKSVLMEKSLGKSAPERLFWTVSISRDDGRKHYAALAFRLHS